MEEKPCQHCKWGDNRAQIVVPKESSPPLQNSTYKDKKMSWFGNIFNKPDRGEDRTILQALLIVDMLFSSFAGNGTSVVVVDNFGRISKSLG